MVLQILKRLYHEQDGGVAAAAFIFMTTLLGLGVIVGVVTLRDHIVTEFGDVAVALDNLSQSFSYSVSIDTDGDGLADTVCTAATYADDAPTLVDPIDGAPACLNMNVAPTAEGPVQPQPTGEFP